MSGVASLPMYAAPAEAKAAFWNALRVRLEAAGVPAPETLSEPGDLGAHWLDPELVLSQTCGLPLTTSLRGKVEVVGVPHYAALGCRGPRYSSLILVRTKDVVRRPDELRGRHAAINDFGSHSGASQLFSVIGPEASGFFGRFVVSGSHLNSLELVRAGEADVAAIDCVTFALAARDQPLAVRGLRIIARTRPSLGLPFITARGASAERVRALRAAIASALKDQELAKARASLLISGFSPLDADAYSDFQQPAAGAAPSEIVKLEV